MVIKIAYLTIDDCPSIDMKRKVNFLLEKRIPAIWFCRGELLEKRQQVVIYAIRKGFVIGNHSYDHPHFSEIPLEECFRQIKVTDELIEAVYEKAGIERPAKVFRFPWGDKGGGFDVKKGGFSPRRENHACMLCLWNRKLLCLQQCSLLHQPKCCPSPPQWID